MEFYTQWVMKFRYVKLKEKLMHVHGLPYTWLVENSESHFVIYFILIKNECLITK